MWPIHFERIFHLFFTNICHPGAKIFERSCWVKIFGNKSVEEVGEDVG